MRNLSFLKDDMRVWKTALFLSVIFALAPMMLQAKSEVDTVSKALTFYRLAPRIYADLVKGDSCQARFLREQDARMIAEKGKVSAEINLIKSQATSAQKQSQITLRYQSANKERWAWRSFFGVVVTILIISR